MLSDLGIRKISLLTNTPTHVPALQGFGVEIVEQLAVGKLSFQKRGEVFEAQSQ